MKYMYIVLWSDKIIRRFLIDHTVVPTSMTPFTFAIVSIFKHKFASPINQLLGTVPGLLLASWVCHVSNERVAGMI